MSIVKQNVVVLTVSDANIIVECGPIAEQQFAYKSLNGKFHNVRNIFPFFGLRLITYISIYKKPYDYGFIGWKETCC